MKLFFMLFSLFVGLWLMGAVELSAYKTYYSDGSYRRVIDFRLRGIKFAKELNYYDHKIAICEINPKECENE